MVALAEFEMKLQDDVERTVERAAEALRVHWNTTRAKAPQSGDSMLGMLIGRLLEALSGRLEYPKADNAYSSDLFSDRLFRACYDAPVETCTGRIGPYYRASLAKFARSEAYQHVFCTLRPPHEHTGSWASRGAEALGQDSMAEELVRVATEGFAAESLEKRTWIARRWSEEDRARYADLLATGGAS